MLESADYLSEEDIANAHGGAKQVLNLNNHK
jgi:hypothetical protein